MLLSSLGFGSCACRYRVGGLELLGVEGESADVIVFGGFAVWGFRRTQSDKAGGAIGAESVEVKPRYVFGCEGLGFKENHQKYPGFACVMNFVCLDSLAADGTPRARLHARNGEAR